MTGLLQKDFYNLRTAIKNLLLILVIFIAYLIFRKHEFILPLVPVLLSSSLLTTVINLDRHSKWNMLMITAPLQKSELVKEKYVLLMLLNVSGVLIGTIVSIPFIISGTMKLVSWMECSTITGNNFSYLHIFV